MKSFESSDRNKDEESLKYRKLIHASLRGEKLSDEEKALMNEAHTERERYAREMLMKRAGHFDIETAGDEELTQRIKEVERMILDAKRQSLHDDEIEWQEYLQELEREVAKRRNQHQ